MARQVSTTPAGPDALGAVNARPRAVVDYAPNPVNPGRQVIHDALLRLHGFLVPAMVGGDADPELQFHGYGPELQSVRGAVNPSATTIVYADPSGAELSSAEVAGPMGDPARRIFADRLRRRQGAL